MTKQNARTAIIVVHGESSPSATCAVINVKRVASTLEEGSIAVASVHQVLWE